MRTVLFKIALLVPFFMGSVSAQNQDKLSIPFAFSPKPTNCETNHVRLDSYAKAFRADGSPDGVIIAIARLGTGERSPILNKSRLYVVRATLVGDLKLKEQDVVTAVGNPIEGYGRIEVYLNGKLIDALLVNRGKALCADCCYPEGRKYSYQEPMGRP
jgi:hypothetical protein